jgi:hypothetical protein
MVFEFNNPVSRQTEVPKMDVDMKTSKKNKPLEEKKPLSDYFIYMTIRREEMKSHGLIEQAKAKLAADGTEGNIGLKAQNMLG